MMEQLGQIQELSFDLWFTLIRPNPEFKLRRTEMLLNHTRKSQADILQMWQDFKTEYDGRAEQHGEGFSSEYMFELICERLEMSIPPAQLSEAYMDIFRKYPPMPNENNLPAILEQLAGKCPLHLNSNTMFTPGRVLKEIFQNPATDFHTYFTSFTFSDEVGFSKPSHVIFEKSYDYMSSEKEHIVHIGDNYLTDYLGAKKYGFQSILLTQNNHQKNIISATSIQEAAVQLLKQHGG